MRYEPRHVGYHPARACLALALAFVPHALADDPIPSADQVRAAVNKALKPIELSVREYPNHRDCFSCHHQATPAIALDIARRHGFTVSDEIFDAIRDVTLDDLERAADSYRKGEGQGGGSTRAGYALWALDLTNHKPDATTKTVASFLAKSAREGQHWRASSNRPPTEASWFTTTAVALRGVRRVSDAAEAPAFDRVRSWLERAEVKDTEDAVFRLWGLHFADRDAPSIPGAVAWLLAAQNPDGGWSQSDDMASDAYATGSVLTALHVAGRVPTSDTAYSRGLVWLLAHQRDDGTWHVASRSKPFQPYFESGFPYGKDQFISIAATSWAAAALALACPNASP